MHTYALSGIKFTAFQNTFCKVEGKLLITVSTNQGVIKNVNNNCFNIFYQMFKLKS